MTLKEDLSTELTPVPTNKSPDVTTPAGSPFMSNQANTNNEEEMEVEVDED